MARTYKRDGIGRFAGGGGSSGGGGGKRPAAKSVSRGVNRLTRDNAGKITSVGGEGATARGGRLKTAAGNKRAMQTAKVSGGRPAGTISKKRRGISDSDKQSMQMAKALRSGKPNPAVDAVRRRQENSAASRRQANSLAKGNLLKTTEADRRNRAQSLATAQRKLSEMERTGSGRNSLTGSKTALLVQRAHVAALSKPLPEFRKPNRSDVVAKNRNALARRRSERQNAQIMADFRAKTAKPTAAAATKPAAAPKATAKRKTGQEIMKAEVRKVQNKKLRDINAEIKAAGPNAINLRVEKLALQNNMLATQSRQTAKQVAKSEKQTQVVRGRIAEMRRDRERIGRAAANRAKNADVRNSAAPMSKASFAPRPSKKTIRSQNQADKALDFYANPTKALKTVSKRKPGFRLPRNMR